MGQVRHRSPRNSSFILVYVAIAAFQRSGSQTLNFVHFLAFALKFCDKGLLSVGGVFGRGFT